MLASKHRAGALFQQPELFLLSAAQWEALLRPWVQPPSEEGSIRTTALDVGAGMGWVPFMLIVGVSTRGRG